MSKRRNITGEKKERNYTHTHTRERVRVNNILHKKETSKRQTKLSTE